MSTAMKGCRTTSSPDRTEFRAGISGWLSSRVDMLTSFCASHRNSKRSSVIPVDPPGQANLSMGAHFVGERFDCLSMTLEQPFKDAANRPHRDGWSPKRARRLGQVQLDALRTLIDSLR